MKAPLQLLLLPAAVFALVALNDDTALLDLVGDASMVKLREASTTPVRDLFKMPADARILDFAKPAALDGRMGLQQRQFSGDLSKIDTTAMCGAFQQLPYRPLAENETSDLTFSTGAALFKVPKLYRRKIVGVTNALNSTDDQVLSMYISVDNVWCRGVVIGIMASISALGLQTNAIYYQLPDAEAVVVDTIDVYTGDTIAAAVHTRPDGTARLLIVNRSTNQGGEDDFATNPNCGQSVSWMVQDVIITAEDSTNNYLAAKYHGDHFPDFEPIRFRYMDANRTDGATAHLNGSTFASFVYAANSSETLRPLCRGAMSTNVTNELRITSY